MEWANGGPIHSPDRGVTDTLVPVSIPATIEGTVRGALAVAALVAAGGAWAVAHPAQADVPVNATEAPTEDFAAARAVLEARCLTCHGGDDRRSGLSFADAATFAEGGARGPAVAYSAPGESRLLELIRYEDPSFGMPPTGPLPDDERAALERWVLAGAPWPEGDAGRLADPSLHPRESEPSHEELLDWWSYAALPPAPELGPTELTDARIDALLAERGIEPAPLASPEALLRRASFVLTGLPPTPDERRAFLADVDARGFEPAWSALLDRLFASPHHGEAEARRWLDIVRYAETNGYERDSQKPAMWRYRDWVIRAFADDMPYDEFGRLQIAGDEIARGIEGGDAEAMNARSSALLATGYFRLGTWDDEPADRLQAASDGRADVVDTTSQAFFGATLGCARCHDHKADPISQADYFSFTAHFRGVVGYGGGAGRGAGATTDVADAVPDGLLTSTERDARVAALDARVHDLAREAGVADDGGATLVRDARGVPRDERTLWRYSTERYQDAAWAAPAFDDSKWSEGRAGFGRRGTPAARVGTPWAAKEIQLRTTFQLDEIPRHLGLTVHHDDDIVVYLNGVPVFERSGYVVDYFRAQLPRSAREALVVGRNVLAVSCVQDFGGQYVDVGLDTRLDPTSQGASLAISELIEEGDGEAAERARELLGERRDLLAAPVEEAYPAQVVFEYGARPPQQYVELRGSAHAPGDPVEPGVPEAWLVGASAPYDGPAPAPEGAPSSLRRRALAEWAFDGGAHITARVEVNRIWQGLFGVGLTRAPGDFGRFGQPPTHPALLDGLAAHFVASGWSRRELQRALMETRAWRRASSGPDASYAADPTNELFWRFPPRRLTGEEFRDATLVASGEINRERFGPWIFTPLPAEVLSTSSRPESAWGTCNPAQAVRRSVYIHVKRSLREPLLAALDQPDPDIPCPERFPTNVPTQALLTLNGEFTLERAMAFAEDLADAADTPEGRVRRAIERALGRAPGDGEVERALAFIDGFEAEEGAPPPLALFALSLFNRNEFLWLD